MNLSDQLVLVTGGARGLGRHIVTAFAGQGARVIINYRQSAQAAQELASTLGPDRALAVQADVTDPAQVATMLETAQAHFGSPVTTVVNNALADFSFNGEARSSAADIGWEEFTTQFSGSVRGALNTSQAALPGMREHGFGRIINIGTNLFQNPVVPYHDYTASKAALLALTRTLAADLGQHEVSVNMVSGGLLRTTDASAATPEEVIDFIASSTPLRKVTTPAQIADALLLVASPWARAVT
ncbi:MAG: 3-oxoacyl-ACP reductase, partial [Micrococcaceae bacterium]|nr:3-oxoacyl-ACP reductase [Micrococcaceae bacterium]